MKTFAFKLLFGASLLALPVFATPILTFTTSSASNDVGAIVVSGSTITGTGIGFLGLGVSGATSGNGTWNLTGSATGGAAALNFDYSTTTNTGTFSLVGTAAQGGNSVSSTTLISGSITSGTLNQATSLAFNLAFNAGTALVADTLETFLGIPTSETYTITGFEIGTSTAGTPYKATSSSVTATGAAATPEPASLVLFGTGLIALAGFARKSRQQR
jgi:hypothetical protein